MLYAASRELEVRATARRFFDVVWDFARYPEFISGVAGVETLERPPVDGERARALVRVDATLLGVTFHYVLECVREGERRVTWRRTAGSFREAHGAWTLLGENDGRLSLRYENAVDPGFIVPAFVVKLVLDRQLPRLLADVRGRVESVEVPS